MIQWIRKDELAKTSRPGYGGERGAPVADAVVDAWIHAVKEAGIESIICLLNEDQLPIYSSLPQELPEYYRSAGFEVAHIPVTDHQSPPMTASDLDHVWGAYQTLRKPVLVHCSAGVDRSGAAIRHIQDCLSISTA